VSARCRTACSILRSLPCNALGAAAACFALLVCALIVTAPAVFADPHTDYILHCQGCHRADGSGVPERVPSFRNQLARFVQVPQGREYLLRVPGTSQSELSDARVATLLNWMLHEFSPEQVPPTFVPFTAQEVARGRRPPLTDVDATRRALVDAIEALPRTAADH
jgi:mono/diheme cytochrome c family protein